MYGLLEMRNPEKLEELKKIWEPRKEYIEKDLWVIRNFLTDEELNWIQKEARDPIGWYTTMRSAYGGNTKNKFLGYIPQYDDNGNMLPPHPDNNPVFDIPMFMRDVEDRMEAVLPKYFSGAAALQSLFEVPEEEIIKELGNTVDYSIPWHYERDDDDPEEVQTEIAGATEHRPAIRSENKISASFNVYINDDFDGGVLEFQQKEYKINPEPGMLIHIPIYKEFEHRVTKVTNGNRHTLYGRCWTSLDNYHLSSADDC